MKAETETTKCKKCAEEHRIESYREVKYYVCPHVNRVLLVNQDEKEGIEYAEHFE